MLAKELTSVEAQTGVEDGLLYLTDGQGNELKETVSYRVLQTNAGPDVRTDGTNGFVVHATSKADGRLATACYRDGEWS